MTIIEKIKAEIERRLKNGEKKILLGESNPYWDTAVMSTLANLLSFISTLESENPMNQEGLDEEIIKCWQEWVSPSNKQSVEGVLPLSEFAFYARHFAQWGSEHLKK